jgi:hypothetical protein
VADDLNLLHGTVTDGGGPKTFLNPGNANDGVAPSEATVMPFAGVATHSYLETDLGIAYAIAEHMVWGDWECSSDPTAGGWSIEYSDDGSAWTAADYTASRLGTPSTADHRVRFVLDSTETHRYWRIKALHPTIGYNCGTSIFTWEIFGETAPTEPPVDPGYEEPDPGHAILEIYVHDEDATRWGTATWSADLTPTGTEGIWSGAGWQDVTPQGVRAHVTWGSSRPERGILAVQEAQSWRVETYDPDRILDPGNESSPFAPQLVSGVPIRISNSASGRVIRTGIIDRIAYRYRAPEYRGDIIATSTIANAWRADVPDDSVLGDTLRERIRDAVIASGVAIGGIPILGNDDSYPDIPLSPRIEGAANLWTHISKAGEEVHWVIYEDAAGTLQARPWGGPMDRGSEITYENLEDLEAASTEDGVYSVVRVTDDTTPTPVVIERVAAPLPRYGRRVYERDETTILADSWADAVLADRAWPGVRWTPGTVWCFDAADVDFMASLEIMERVRIVVPGVVDVSGVLLGMEMWVEALDDDTTRWHFLPRIATEGSTALGMTILVADDGSGDFLVDDDGGTDFLEYEG